MILTVVISLAFSLVSGQDCADFTLGGCSLNEAALVAEFTLPGDQSDFVLCQDLCQIEERCNYFLWESGLEGTCLLYTQYEIETCEMISGTALPDLFEVNARTHLSIAIYRLFSAFQSRAATPATTSQS